MTPQTIIENQQKQCLAGKHESTSKDIVTMDADGKKETLRNMIPWGAGYCTAPNYGPGVLLCKHCHCLFADLP